MSKTKHKIVPIKSSDKFFHEKYGRENKDDLFGNFIHPFVCIIANGKNVGKTSLSKNIIANKTPPFEKIIVYSPLKNTTEWSDDIPEVIMINNVNEIFDKNLINRSERSLLVCDDLAMVDLPKTEQRAISNLIRYESTHNNISVILINQNIYDLLPVVRRCSDYTILYKLSDVEFMKSLCRKFDIDLADLKFIFKNLITEKGDNLLIDEVCDKEYRLRKNIYTPITLKNKNIEN